MSARSRPSATGSSTANGTPDASHASRVQATTSKLGGSACFARSPRVACSALVLPMMHRYAHRPDPTAARTFVVRAPARGEEAEQHHGDPSISAGAVRRLGLGLGHAGAQGAVRELPDGRAWCRRAPIACGSGGRTRRSRASRAAQSGLGALSTTCRPREPSRSPVSTRGCLWLSQCVRRPRGRGRSWRAQTRRGGCVRRARSPPPTTADRPAGQ